MTQYQPPFTDITPIALPDTATAELAARRRAFVRDWLASRQRAVRVVMGGLLALPLLALDQADAQTGGFVRADSIQGVSNIAVNADGTASVTISNGQIVTIPAAEVAVLADGTVAVSTAAAQSLSSLVAATAGGLGGLGGLGGAAGAAAAAAGAAAALGGGGGGPAATVGIQGGDLVLNALEVTSDVVFAGTAPANSLVTVTFNGVTLPQVTATAGGTYTATFASAQLPVADGTYTVSVEVQPVNAVAVPTGAPFTITQDIVIDTTPPTVAINAGIAGDGVINIAESGQPLGISGTTDAENGRTVTVTVTGTGGFSASATALVVGGAWSVSIPAVSLAGLPDGAVLTVTAAVSDAAGNPAVPATATVNTDLTAPTITIGAVGTADTLTKFNELNGVTISGTTTAEDGQAITVTFNGNTYSGNAAAGLWSVTVPAGDINTLATGDTRQISAAVSDAAGNPATAATRTVGVDYTGPSVQIAAVSVDNVINIAERDDAAGVTISGTTINVEDGQLVEVDIVLAGGGLGAPLFNATTAVSGNAWSLVVPQGIIAGLADGGSFVVLANVSDLSGVAAPQATRSLTTDYTAPTVAITTPVAVDGAINIAESTQSLTIAGTTTGVEDGQTVTVIFGTAQQTATVTGNAWSVTIPAADVTANVTDGVVTNISATISDAAGNPATPAAATVTVDLTAPTVTISTVGTADTLTKFNELNGVTISGTTTAEDTQTVTVTFNGNTYTGNAAAGLWSVTVPAGDINTLATGDTRQISAAVSDAAGNPATAATRTVGVDYTGPGIAISTIAGDDFINIAERDDAAGVTISGTATNVEDGQLVDFTLALSTSPGVAVLTTTATVTGGAWSVILTPVQAAALGDGETYVARAEVSDASGVAATPATRFFGIDYTAPTISIDATIAGDNVINIAEQTGGFTVSGTSTDASGQTVLVDIGGSAAGSAVVQGDGTWSLSVPAGNLPVLVHGAPVVVTASVSDGRGNPSNPATRDLTVDIEAPTLAIDATIAGDNVINIAEQGAGITVTGTSTGAAGQTVTVTVNGGAGGTAVVAGDGTWLASIPAGNLAGIADGATVTLAANVSDTAGNPATTATRDLTADLAAPTLAIDATIAGDNVINIAEQGAGITVTGTSTGAAGQTVTVTVNGGAGGTAVVAGDGTWSASIPAGNLVGIADGATVTLAANVSDAAGNPATEATRSLTADLTAPTITLTSPVAGDGLINAVERDTGFDVSGTTNAEQGQTVSVTLNGLPAGTGTVGAGGAWTVTIPQAALLATANGDVVTFAASVTDAAGNPSAPGSATATATVDTLAPGLDITSPIAGDNIINAAELAAGFTLGGNATGAEDGRIVTVTVTGPGGFTTTTTGAVASNAWTATFTPAQLAGLPDGASLNFTAAVSDLAGNLAEAGPVAVTTDLTAPSLSITTPIAVDGIINAAEQAEALVVSGTATGAENGQTVTVTITGAGGFEVQQTATVTAGAWTATFAAGALTTAPDASTLTITADVSDLAGNPAPQASTTVTTAFTLPTVTIDSHADDGLVTGTSTGLATGANVNLSVGSESYTATVDAQGNWSFQIPKAAAANSFVGLGNVYNTSQTATASVADAAGNPGSFNGSVLIYRDAGNAMLETSRTADTATYSFFSSTERAGQEFHVVSDESQVTFQSYTAAAQFGIALAVPSNETGDPSIKFTAAVFVGAPPAMGQPVATMTYSFDGGSSNVLTHHVIKPNLPQDHGGWSELFMGSSAADSITVNAWDSIVRGGGGNDTIDLSAGGRNIVMFEANAAANGGDTITGFDLSNAKLPDAILFADLVNADLRGAGTAFQSVAFGGALDADAGFVLMSTPLLTDGFNTIALGVTSLTGVNPLDSFYFMAGEGTNAWLALVNVDAGGSVSIHHMAAFNGIGDLSNLTADQLQNFV